MSFTELGRKHLEFVKMLHAKTAAGIMNKDIVSVSEDVSVEAAFRLMVDKKLKRLPVLDAKGLFAGMLTRDSLLRAGVNRR